MRHRRSRGFGSWGAGLGLVFAASVMGGAVQAASPAPSMPAPGVVSQALHAVAHRTGLGLAGPLEVPARAAGYVTARAQAGPSTYTVWVLQTTRALGINSTQINEYLSQMPRVATFGAMRLAQAQPPMGAPNYLAALAQHNPDYVHWPVAVNAVAYPNLGLGIRGAVYQYEGKTVLDWTEGDWTVQISGGTVAREEEAAPPIVAYLHRYFLPPHPGIFAVHLTRATGPLATRTWIDWMNGHVLNYVTDPTPAGDNATASAAMAVSWHVFRPA